MKKKAPELIFKENDYCPGCGHAIFDRILAESLLELEIADKAICAVDIACSSIMARHFHIDYVHGPHGRMAAVAKGIKSVRPDNIVFGRCGDGAAYAIGLAETMSAAIRNDNITMFVINNGVYAMTGGQMAPTTLPGQITASSPYGKDIRRFGQPVDVTKLMAGLDIAYLARGALADVKDIKKSKKFIKKAFQKQMNKLGFSFVEIISLCPTNWGLAPTDAMERLKNEVLNTYCLGEFVDKETI
jgi:pyruvate/2-oxoacid:ferredoxin oxidoreductase beta subunit